jgi:hypothetical protein
MAVTTTLVSTVPLVVKTLLDHAGSLAPCFRCRAERATGLAPEQNTEQSVRPRRRGRRHAARGPSESATSENGAGAADCRRARAAVHRDNRAPGPVGGASSADAQHPGPDVAARIGPPRGQSHPGAHVRHARAARLPESGSSPTQRRLRRRSLCARACRAGAASRPQRSSSHAPQPPARHSCRCERTSASSSRPWTSCTCSRGACGYRGCISARPATPALLPRFSWSPSSTPPWPSSG